MALTAVHHGVEQRNKKPPVGGLSLGRKRQRRGVASTLTLMPDCGKAWTTTQRFGSRLTTVRGGAVSR